MRAAYRECRRLNARHGKTFFLATALLAAEQRSAVHALYGFARWVDDLVDEPPPGWSASQLDEELARRGRALTRGFAAGHSAHPVLAALVDTAARYRLSAALFTDFLAAMRLDLTVTDYPDRLALERYMHGSAGVIGLQVLPVLGLAGTGANSQTALAASRAATLGRAFQLTNFLRDVAEDFQRGRVYLPADELAAFGVDRDRLGWCVEHRRGDVRVRRALADQVATTRAVYRAAQPGVAMLHPRSRPCVAAAARLYGEILDRIEAAGYDVFCQRATVPQRRRVTVAAGGLARVVVTSVRHPRPRGLPSSNGDRA